MIENRGSSKSGKDMQMDLRQLLKILRKYSKLIAAITVLFTLTAGLVSYFVLEPVYQTTTLLMVTVASDKLINDPDQPYQTDPATGVPARNIIPVLTMNTYLGQLKSEAMMRRVIDRMGMTDQSIASMSRKIEAAVIKDSNLIEVKVSHNNPQMAYDIANAVSVEYLALTREFMFSSVVVISPANLPTDPVKPYKKMNVILAFISGLMLSGLLAILLDYLDNTVKTVADVNNQLDIPVLGMIPAQNRRTSKQRSYGGNL